MLTALAVAGYRSLRDLTLELAPLTVITGANGTGKSSLYRALRLLAATSTDGAIPALAAEGGLQSTLWAGPEVISSSMRDGTYPIQGITRNAAIALKLGFASDELSYAVDFGLPTPSTSAFARDPEIKTENVWSGPVHRSATALTERRGPLVRFREGSGWRSHEYRLPVWTSMLSAFADPETAPELLALRQQVRAWRFYDHVRTDQDSPARRSVIGTRTPVLSADGSDLPAALQTIREIGDDDAMTSAIASALEGSRVSIQESGGRFSLLLHQDGLLRPLEAPELSDGTLRYLLWVAALLSPRPAPLLVLNEPETSLHPSLFAPLGDLIAAASAESQIIVVSHSAALVERLQTAGALRHELLKDSGQTRVAGLGALEGPLWAWPKR